MAIDIRYDEEDVDGATSFQKGEITTSTLSNPTDNSTAHREEIYRESTEKSTGKSTKSTKTAEAAYRERNHEVDRMVTEADFQR